jgi:hypothetical protein
VQGLRSIFDKINAADEERAAETFRFMEEQKIRKTLAPIEWEKLKEQLIRECANLTSASTKHVIQAETQGVNELRLKNTSTGKTAKFTYKPEMPCVVFEGFDGGGHFAFRPSADGMTVQWFDTKRNTVTSINDISFEVTAYLIH